MALNCLCLRHGNAHKVSRNLNEYTFESMNINKNYVENEEENDEIAESKGNVKILSSTRKQEESNQNEKRVGGGIRSLRSRLKQSCSIESLASIERINTNYKINTHNVRTLKLIRNLNNAENATKSAKTTFSFASNFTNKAFLNDKSQECFRSQEELNSKNNTNKKPPQPQPSNLDNETFKKILIEYNIPNDKIQILLNLPSDKKMKLFNSYLSRNSVAFKEEPVEKFVDSLQTLLSYFTNKNLNHSEREIDCVSLEEAAKSSGAKLAAANTTKSTHSIFIYENHLKRVEDLKLVLKTSPLSFVSKFVELKGFEIMLDLLNSLKTKWRKNELHTNLIMCLKALMNNGVIRIK